jgi:hypothetical protein
LFSIYKTTDRQREKESEREIKCERENFKNKVQSIISDGAKMKKMLIKVKHIKCVRFSECALNKK